MSPHLRTSSSRRGRRVLLAAAALLLVAAWGLYRQVRPPRAPVGGPRAEATLPSPELAIARRAPASEPTPTEPVIDEIRVDPPVVCDGDEAIVTVRAHMPGGDDRALHVAVDGVRGSPAPVVIRVEPSGKTRPVVAVVVGPDDKATTAPVPVEARTCAPRRRLEVGAHTLVNAPDDWEMTARVLDVPTRDGRRPRLPISDVRSYQWTFGDGTRDETPTPTVTHSYAGRSQDRRYTTMLVRVEAVLADGSRVAGHQALELANHAYASLHDRDLVRLEGRFRTRFAERRPGGALEQVLTISHIADRPVAVTEVIARESYRDGRGVLEHAVPVKDVLGAPEVPAGRGLETTLRIAADADPALLFVTYLLRGQAADGKPALGSLTIMRPTPIPTADQHVAVTDPQLVRKIEAARKILGKPFVTGEEIARLEREGAFDTLE